MGTETAAAFDLMSLERLLRDRHPVMCALTTKIEHGHDSGVEVIRLTFDGPALPEKTVHMFGVQANLDDRFESALLTCERTLAAVIRKAGLGG